MKKIIKKINKIALFHDISGYGNCSLTATIPILNAMGHEVHPVPTAVLSNQTAYDSYFMVDCSENIERYLDQWYKLGEKLDYVYTGFTLKASVLENARALAALKDAKLLVDPVLGDNGKMYKCFNSTFIPAYIDMIAVAEYITPNLTEACLLTGENIEKVFKITEKADMIAKVDELLEKLYKIGAKKIIITGIVNNGNIYNAYFDGKNKTYIKVKRYGVNYSGTGDLFASLFLGYILNGYGDIRALEKSIKFIGKCIETSIANKTPPTHGVDFCALIKKL